MMESPHSDELLVKAAFICFVAMIGYVVMVRRGRARRKERKDDGTK